MHSAWGGQWREQFVVLVLAMMMMMMEDMVNHWLWDVDRYNG